MRIAIVTTFYPPYNFGGDGQYVRRLAHALAGRGHEIHIIQDIDGYRVLSGVDELETPPEPDGVTVHRLKSKTPMLSSLATQQLGVPLFQGGRIEKILRSGFDVIHYHNISLVGGPGVLRLGGDEAVKLYTAHEHWLVCPMHILWKDNREVCQKKSCLTCAINHKRPPQLWRYSPLLKNAGRHVDAFLSLSEFCAGRHEAFGFPFPMRVTPSFLPDTDIVEPIKRDRPYFLLVGRLEIIKGFQDVIPAFDNDSPADLLIAGDGNYEDELRKVAEGRNSVIFLGRQTPEELRGLYRGARALIASSRCYEVFPLVLLEAFQQETPAIGRELGPYPEIINQAEGGLTFKNEQELRSAITTLTDPEGPRDRLGKNARAAFDARWSEKIAIDRFEALVEEIKAQKKAA